MASRAQERRNLNKMVSAARRHKVPVWIMVAVKLLETGNDLSTTAVSSAGAGGPFQLMPATARSLGVRDPNNFGEAANGAAKLLRANFDQFGSWNAALEAYNGGPGAVGQGYAYTQADAEAKLREFGTSKEELGGGPQLVGFGLKDLKKALDKVFGYALGGILGGDEATEGLEKGDPGKVLEGALPFGAIGDFFELLTSGETWIRLGEIIAGAILAYMGLKALTGQGASDLPGASAVRAAVPV